MARILPLIVLAAFVMIIPNPALAKRDIKRHETITREDLLRDGFRFRNKVEYPFEKGPDLNPRLFLDIDPEAVKKAEEEREKFKTLYDTLKRQQEFFAKFDRFISDGSIKKGTDFYNDGSEQQEHYLKDVRSFIDSIVERLDRLGDKELVEANIQKELEKLFTRKDFKRIFRKKRTQGKMKGQKVAQEDGSEELAFHKKLLKALGEKVNKSKKDYQSRAQLRKDFEKLHGVLWGSLQAELGIPNPDGTIPPRVAGEK